MKNRTYYAKISGICVVLLVLLAVSSFASAPGDDTECGVPGYRPYPSGGSQGSYGLPYQGFCGRWVPVQFSIPARTVYQPVVIPEHSMIRYQWIPESCQPVAYQPTWNVWGGYNTPYQPYQPQRDGYFNVYGVWVPLSPYTR